MFKQDFTATVVWFPKARLILLLPSCPPAEQAISRRRWWRGGVVRHHFGHILPCGLVSVSEWASDCSSWKRKKRYNKTDTETAKKEKMRGKPFFGSLTCGESFVRALLQNGELPFLMIWRRIFLYTHTMQEYALRIHFPLSISWPDQSSVKFWVTLIQLTGLKLLTSEWTWVNG